MRNRTLFFSFFSSLGLWALLLFTMHAYAQRVEDYRNQNINVSQTRYVSLPDGGATISSCATATSSDGGYTLSRCTLEYTGRTAGQRNALANCLNNGEMVWALDSNIRADSGF